MFHLPLDTHRNLIEPIAGTSHVKIVLQKRFLSFVEQIKKSSKKLPKLMFNLIKDDIRSNTGSNLRGILLQTTKVNVSQLDMSDIQQLKYHQINDDQRWKTGVVSELLRIRNEDLVVDGFSMVELEEILFHLCSD